MGYDVSAQVIDFSEYGVPQRRKRFILAGVQKSVMKKAGDFVKKLKENRDSFLSERGLSKDTAIIDAISDLLRSNGTVPTPDRKNFLSGVYGEVTSHYQEYMRQGVEGQIPQSHSFARHGTDKLACYKKLLAEYPVKGKRIDGKAREAWGIKQRGLFILDGKDVAPTITNMPDDYLHYQEHRQYLNFLKEEVGEESIPAISFAVLAGFGVEWQYSRYHSLYFSGRFICELGSVGRIGGMLQVAYNL